MCRPADLPYWRSARMIQRRALFSELVIGELSLASRIQRVHAYDEAFTSEVPPASTTKSIPEHDYDTEDTHGR
ncbi:hypothetical protein PISMIDRAFT_18053 [Pisolithus microcarpus 441]|uniref:Unplaced genomic scaffold scaffold_317, whole genome shotgun sequence n=1 Tax=Pisolithus microcarpus 441 TaxID=765257 RepID=A0A0C9Y8S6_9AGAM|nr:hypothetical protein BKA83DRAFT_18053 [Pisolithus microcarpus]KIK13356.1 hypothetical protein PISMIDRAFT_18053 [Pisolithus microcarpus 441]